MLLRFLRNVWPRLTWNRRAPVDREAYLADRAGIPLFARNSEVLRTR